MVDKLKDAVDVVLIAYRDRISNELETKLRIAEAEYHSARADAEREKTAAIINSIVKLKSALERFEFQYKQIKKEIGPVETLENIINELKNEIEDKIRKKNKR